MANFEGQWRDGKLIEADIDKGLAACERIVDKYGEGRDGNRTGGRAYRLLTEGPYNFSDTGLTT